MFCQATGYGGTVQQGSTVEAKLRARGAARNEELEAAAAAREVTVSFNANVIDGLPWRFVPTQRSVTINPGQSTLAFYTAHNLGDRDITGALPTCGSLLSHALPWRVWAWLPIATWRLCCESIKWSITCKQCVGCSDL